MDDTLNQNQPTPVTEPTATVPGQVPPPPMGQVEPQAPVEPTAPVTEPTATVPGQVPPPPMGQVEPQAPVEPTAPVTEPTATVPGQVPPQVEPVESENPNPVNPVDPNQNSGGVVGGGIGA